MSHEAALRSMYAAMNDKNTEALKPLIADDAVFHLLPNPLIPAATLTGKDEIFAFMEENVAQLDMQQEISAISENGDFATVYVTSESKGEDGSTQTVAWADLFQFEDGRIKAHVGLSA
jgi:ketosteroid isomerase-like protein